jgi:hypothetical protein
MQISHIASYLVSPGKGLENPPEVNGIMLKLSGRLFEMLNEIFERADTECDIPVRFAMAEDGSQRNEARDFILSFIDNPGLSTGEALATRMRDFTTQKSGLALLFIICGTQGNNKKVVLSRFPADEGIVVEQSRSGIQVEYIERVFMKNKRYYKAAVYRGDSFKGDFWDGLAVDKQIDKLSGEAANYWIFDFLDSDFITTSKSGTRRLANAFRSATTKANDLAVKKELVAASTLVHNLRGRKTSIEGVIRRFNLTEAAREILAKQVSQPGLLEEMFLLDGEEYSQHATYTSIELDNNAVLAAPQEEFEKYFSKEAVDGDPEKVRFTIEGKITDEKIKGKI